MKKVKMVIERHQYAPELNKAHFISDMGKHVATVSAPGVMTVAQYRAKHKPIDKPRRVVVIKTSYPDKWKSLERTISGRVDSYEQIKTTLDDLRRRCGGGWLKSGEWLPPAAFTISIKLIG